MDVYIPNNDFENKRNMLGKINKIELDMMDFPSLHLENYVGTLSNFCGNCNSILLFYITFYDEKFYFCLMKKL